MNLRQASNRCKRVLEAAKVAYAHKTKESITRQDFASDHFSRISNSVFHKDKSVRLPLSETL